MEVNLKAYRGGCSCGQVRFELADDPTWVIICHCNECKKRTGSAYGVSVVTTLENVQEFNGTTNTYDRAGDSGDSVRFEFCSNCGTTVRWQIGLLPGRVGFAGGTFDDISVLNLVGEVYTNRRAPWIQTHNGVCRALAPDDDARSQWAEASKAS